MTHHVLEAAAHEEHPFASVNDTGLMMYEGHPYMKIGFRMYHVTFDEQKNVYTGKKAIPFENFPYLEYLRDPQQLEDVIRTHQQRSIGKMCRNVWGKLAGVLRLRK